MLDLTTMTSPDSTWKLRYDALDSGTIISNAGSLFNFNTIKRSKEFMINYNMRVRAINPRHIVIEDLDPESLKGEKYYTPNITIMPYEKVIDTVGLVDPIAKTSYLKVYPTPADGQLVVEVQELNKQIWVNLVDVYGRVVKNLYNENSGGSFLLNTSDIPAGVYFLQVRGTSKMEAIKVEIVH
jgi:hypothetical protein